MDQDKALKKILNTGKRGDLPYGFEDRLMKGILLEAKKQRKRAQIRILGLISSVSLVMVVGTILLIHRYLAVKITMPAPDVRFSPEAGGMFGFFFYIAFLVLVLLVLDTYFRNLRQKPRE
jgi:hypothetical protein